MKKKNLNANLSQSSEIVHLRHRHNLAKLVRLSEKYAPYDGAFELPFDGLLAVRASQVQDEETFMVSKPGLCVVAQGAKAVASAKEVFEYDANKLVVYVAEVPIHVKIAKATPDEPYLCIVIPIEASMLAELISKVFPRGVPKRESTRAIYVGDCNYKIVDSTVRMLELIEQQDDMDLLIPLMVEEILIRLLRSPEGASIAQISIHDSNAYKISKVISWLKSNYTQSIKMEELAKIAGMSISSFHVHFKEVTTLTPLQFQKTLRLQEAKNLITSQMMDISSAALAVGYSSSTQFSREYARMFGVSPSKDS